MRTSSVIAVLTMLTTQAVAHSGGLNKQGCHSGSQPYHCHKSAKVAPVASLRLCHLEWNRYSCERWRYDRGEWYCCEAFGPKLPRERHSTRQASNKDRQAI